MGNLGRRDDEAEQPHQPEVSQLGAAQVRDELSLKQRERLACWRELDDLAPEWPTDFD